MSQSNAVVSAGAVALAILGCANRTVDERTSGVVSPRSGESTPASLSADLVEAVVYTKLCPPNWDIYLFDDASNRPQRLTDDPALDYNAVFSPDARWVVFTSERSGSPDLYALDLTLGGDPVRLTSRPTMDDAASFSPDGQQLAFVSTRDGYADIFVMPFLPEDQSAEERAVNLTRSPAGDFNPAFSPDGRRIAFSRQECHVAEDGLCWNVEVCVMNGDGSNVRRLAKAGAGAPPHAKSTDGVAGSPAWSPDRAFIYYYTVYIYERASIAGASDWVEGGPDIRRVSLDGSGDELVMANGYSPAFARGGRRAFVRPSERDGPPEFYTGRIYSVAADGSDLRAETPALESWLDGRFAPDFDRSTGRMVCHGPTSEPAKGLGLPQGRSFVSPVGVGQVKLPDRTIEVRAIGAYFPALTADGEVLWTRRIRSAADVSAGRNVDLTSPLLISRIDGSEYREVFGPPSGIAWGAHVARDVGWVVVGVGDTFSPFDAAVDIWRFDLDGQGAVILTPESPGNDALPTISADGQRIVFRSGRDGARGDATDVASPTDMAVYVMGGNGENPHRLTDADARETMPAISPDGDWVVYVAVKPNSAKLWLCRVDGSERRLLEPDRSHIPDKSMHPRFSPDGMWIVFTSDRGGFNEEWPLTPQPQPYGDMWAVPVAGGPAVRLTNDKWEDGPCDWGDVRVHD